MSAPLNTISPLTYPSWLKYQKNIKPDSAQLLYADYIKEWYKVNEDFKKSDSIKDNYIQLLKDLSFLFGKNEKDLFLSELDYANDEELIFSIPFFVKKLKEICKVLSYKRESLKNAKLKYNLVGSNNGLEKLLYEYILKGFTVDENYITQIPISSLSEFFPALSSVNGNFFVELEELHDSQSYHDSDPSVPINEYVDIDQVKNEDIFEGLSEEEILNLISTRYLNRVADTPLSRLFNQYLSEIPYLSSASLFNSATQTIYNEIASNQKYLGESLYGLTAIRLGEIDTPDLTLNLDFKNGNNWFYWPSGERVIDESIFNNVYSPIYINESNLVNSGATGGSDYNNSDLIFSDKSGIVEGAWLRGPRTESSKGIMELTVNATSKREFVFPYPGFKLSSKGTLWNGFSLTDEDYLIYEKLLPEQKRKILESYYTESLPNSASVPIYLNNTSLIYDGAYAAKFSDEADTLFKTYFNSAYSLNNAYSDALSGASEEAFLYRFEKTDIPISIGLNDIAWPLDRIDGDKNLPITILNDTCLPIKLSEINASKTMLGSVAGSSFDNSDVIYKLNTKTGDPIEAAWLGSGSLEYLKVESSIPVYNNPALYCPSYLKGQIQGGLNTKINSREKVSFVWMDEDTPADQVIFYRKHSPDCPYLKHSPHNYYRNQDYGNPNPLNNLAAWTECRCKSVLYSPIGHQGNSVTDYNGMTDYLFADPQGLGEDFAFNTWVDTRGYNPYESPQFSFYQLDGQIGDKEVGWGNGKWKTGDGSPMILKTGRRYTYYRSSLRTDFVIIPNSQTQFETPYIVIKYGYKNIKGIYQTNTLGQHDICIIIDKSKSQKYNLEDNLQIVRNFINGTLSANKNNLRISIIAFDYDKITISYLTNDATLLEFNLLFSIEISTEYPKYQTNILAALMLAEFILTTPIYDNEQPSTLFELCYSLNATIAQAGNYGVVSNLPRDNATKDIIIFSDGYESVNIGTAVPYAKTLKEEKKFNIYSVDIGPLSKDNNVMELMASKDLYFNLEKYLNEGDGNINLFSQYLISLFSLKRIAINPTWYKAIRDTSGNWIATNQISDMILRAGDYLAYVHRDRCDYEGPNNTSFGTPSISFSINAKLNGWNYDYNEFSENYSGSSYGGKPYWGISYTTPESYKDQHFDKQTMTFGGQVRFIDEYLPIHQPEISPMVLDNGNFITYSRKGDKNLIWKQDLSFDVSVSDYQWNKIYFYKDVSNLEDLFGNNNPLDLIAYGTNEKSEIIIESYSSFLPSKYNYFARKDFTYSQDLFKRAKCLNSFVVFNTAIALEAVEPYANLDNMNYPTVATISFPSLATTERETGEYLLPENLGVSYWRGRGYEMNVSGDTLSFIDSISAERLYLNPEKFGPRKRGLTKKDQYSPVEIKDIDNRWMMLSYSSSNAAGRITDTLNNQKFTPYQSKYEITKRNELGLCRQNDDFEFWNIETNTWDYSKKYPLTFRKELLRTSYENRKKELLINKGELVQWKNDIFGNDYGLFKSCNIGISSFCLDNNCPDGIYYSLSSFGSFYFTVSSPASLITIDEDYDLYSIDNEALVEIYDFDVIYNNILKYDISKYVNSNCKLQVIYPQPITLQTNVQENNACDNCIAPSSNDPSTVEYYGYASDPSWCECVGLNAICNSKLVMTTEGEKIGYYCEQITDTFPTNCLIQNNRCIYPYKGCLPPHNFVASKVFVNPYKRSAVAHITGGVDDDCLFEFKGQQLWLRSGDPNTPSCEAGSVDYTVYMNEGESFKLTGYDVYGVCGGINICVTFS